MRSSRRDFLKSAIGGSTLVSLAPAVPAFLARAARAAAEQSDPGQTVLVAIQLSGGNDGLNTVVPYEDDRYGRSRTTLRLAAADVHSIGPGLGFHPEMDAFARLFKEGELTVVQGVGYPNLVRNHDPAMRIWHTARPEEPQCQTGWLGRAVDEMARREEPDVPGAFVGPISSPFALCAERAVVPAIRSADQWTLGPAPGSGERLGRAEAAARVDRAGQDNPLLDHARRGTLAAVASSRRVEAVLRETGTSGNYPPFGLAGSLQTVAQLIRAELGIRIFLAELGGGGIGGFDNHAGQRDNHAALLRQLSDSVAAFVDDLRRDKLLDRVVLLTFSEFGRTLAENGRRGTGHGEAAPMFLAGGMVAGGLVGDHPDLGDLNQGAPKFHTDFRRVYATMLDRWLGLQSRAVLQEPFEPLDLLKA